VTTGRGIPLDTFLVKMASASRHFEIILNENDEILEIWIPPGCSRSLSRTAGPKHDPVVYFC
jgi:hypothetical protein